MEFTLRSAADMLFSGPAREMIGAALDASPLCRRIAAFLTANAHAMDTARGIAVGWVGSDVPAVQAALDCLVACGVVVAHPRMCGAFFGLNRHPTVREWHREAMGRPGERRQLAPDNGRARTAK
jgi:hypothetical protein